MQLSFKSSATFQSKFLAVLHCCHFCAIPAAFASVFLIDFSWSVAWALRRILLCSMHAVCTLQFWVLMDAGYYSDGNRRELLALVSGWCTIVNGVSW